MSNDLIAIVTGGGSGIGRAIAAALAPSCSKILLVGRRPETLAETARALLATAPETAVDEVIADLSTEAGVATVIDRALDCERVDVVVNNAAHMTVAPIEEMTSDLLCETFTTNVHGPALLVAGLWPLFERQGAACIVNVSSMATLDPFPGLAAYAMSKAALESLTRSIVAERGDTDIRAFSLVLGAVETEMLRRVVSKEDLPPSQTLSPTDVARVVVECVAGERDDERGQPISVNHG